MNALYYTLVTVGLACAGPFLLLKQKARYGLRQKLGLETPVLPAISGRRIWFHAVSVGEFNAIFPLLQLIRNQQPDWTIFVSTTTGTGQKQAQEKVGDWATVFYFPFDIPLAINNSLDAIRPAVVVIAETELWPGFTSECAKRGIRLCVANGRISPRSFKNYLKFRWFFSSVLKRFDLVAVQSAQEFSRYAALGAHPQALFVTGNLKFDGITAIGEEERQKLRSLTGTNVLQQSVVVAGSTHDGEEDAILKALKSCVNPFTLVLVPRHPERFEQVARQIEQHGFRPRRYSRNEKIERATDVYLLDTIGLLSKFYGLAEVAFVGGTLVRVGGHSLIEPFAYAVPVICGQYLFKTRDVAQSLLDRDCLVVAEDQEQLVGALDGLLADANRRNIIGTEGKRFLTDSQGAVKKTLTLLEELVNKPHEKQRSGTVLEENVVAGVNGSYK